jgi:hypothetical protein
MYLVEREPNTIRRLDDRRFSELGLSERKHLQEWLAGMPTALGEDLLIIQKEFDGFSDTRERLDLCEPACKIDPLAGRIGVQN